MLKNCNQLVSNGAFSKAVLTKNYIVVASMNKEALEELRNYLATFAEFAVTTIGQKEIAQCSCGWKQVWNDPTVYFGCPDCGSKERENNGKSTPTSPKES